MLWHPGSVHCPPTNVDGTNASAEIIVFHPFPDERRNFLMGPSLWCVMRRPRGAFFALAGTPIVCCDMGPGGVCSMLEMPVSWARHRGQQATEYWLTEYQVVTLCFFARTDNAAAVRKQVREVYMAYVNHFHRETFPGLTLPNAVRTSSTGTSAARHHRWDRTDGPEPVGIVRTYSPMPPMPPMPSSPEVRFRGSHSR